MADLSTGALLLGVVLLHALAGAVVLVRPRFWWEIAKRAWRPRRVSPVEANVRRMMLDAMNAALDDARVVPAKPEPKPMVEPEPGPRKIVL